MKTAMYPPSLPNATVFITQMKNVKYVDFNYF